MKWSSRSIEISREIQAEMEAALRRVVLSQMRSAPELAALAQRGAEEMRRDLRRWYAEGRVLSVRHEGIDYFPLFALNPTDGYRPYPAVAEVIRVLSELFLGGNSWGMVGWFLGLNSYLDDQRPMDLLVNNPDWIAEAAQDEVDETDYPHG